MLVLSVSTACFDSIPSVRLNKFDDCPDLHRLIPELLQKAVRTQPGLALDLSAVEDQDGFHAYGAAIRKGSRPAGREPSTSSIAEDRS